jgi:hypothetical protein
MLNIYIGSIDKTNKQYCEYNDAWFDKYFKDIDFNDTLQKIIKKIDGVEYIGNFRVNSKFEKDTAISVRELSTGCKTALNVAAFPNKTFSVAECGDNALEVMFNYTRGNIYIPYFTIPRKFKNEITVIENDTKTVIKDNTQLEEILYNHFPY